MGTYKVTAQIIFEIESSDSFSEVFEFANSELDTMLEGREIERKSIKIDKLRDRIKKIPLATFTPQEILSQVEEGYRKDFVIDGETYSVKMDSPRYFLFKKGLCCAACGLKGEKMILEKLPFDNSPHFNLYGVEDNKNVLMTKDHIIPKSKGGDNDLENYQNLCSICNNLKGSQRMSLEAIREMREIFNANRKKLTKRELKKLISDTRTRLRLSAH